MTRKFQMTQENSMALARTVRDLIFLGYSNPIGSKQNVTLPYDGDWVELIAKVIFDTAKEALLTDEEMEKLLEEGKLRGELLIKMLSSLNYIKNQKSP